MASPTFVAAYVGPTPAKAPGSTNVTAAIGDTLVCYAGTGDQTLTLNAPTGGAGLTWTLQDSVVTTGGTDCSNCYMWTSPVTATLTAAALSVTKLAGSTSYYWGYFFLRFSGVSGFGGKAVTHITSTGTPTLSLTTTGTNSAIVVGDVDFVPASGTPAWLTNFGAFTQECDQYVASNMGQYGGFHASSGAPATKNVGMTAPTGQTYSIIALELLGPAGNPPPLQVITGASMMRASFY